jgi:glucose-6-phosphate dehydrogenase assembly protein OpcA
MATTTYKVLGQSAPSATTETALYTVPASTETIVSSIVACNRGSSTATYRIYIAVNGAAAANNQYLIFDATLQAKETVALTLGVTMDATDVLRVYSSTADLSFNAFGTEIA